MNLAHLPNDTVTDANVRFCLRLIFMSPGTMTIGGNRFESSLRSNWASTISDGEKWSKILTSNPDNSSQAGECIFNLLIATNELKPKEVVTVAAVFEVH